VQDLQVFMASLRALLENKYPALKQPPLYILKAVLVVMTGMVVQLQTKLYGDYTVEDIIQVGLFSLFQANSGFVLCCPYILLWLFAKHSGIQELQDMDFCTYEEQAGYVGRNQWQHWQHFINLFHVVKSHIFEPGEYSVSAFHHGAILSPKVADLKVYRQPLRLIIASNQLASKSEGYSHTSTVLHEMGTSLVQDCSIFIENAPSAKAGDGFGAVRLTDSTLIHEVFQAKHMPETPQTSTDFIREWGKAAAAKDIFIFFTTGPAQDGLVKALSSRGGLVTEEQFESYFGIFAARAFTAAKVNINQATRKQLMRIPLIGPATVEIILKERALKPFKDRADYEMRTGVKNTIKRKQSDFIVFDIAKE